MPKGSEPDLKIEAASEANRLDRWLWHCRFYKTRRLAVQAIQNGRVHLNAARVKAAHRVKIGDRTSINLQGIVAEFEVLDLPYRRGPASAAQRCYRETTASRARRSRLSEQLRLDALSRPVSDARPDKRERRRLMRLQRAQP